MPSQKKNLERLLEAVAAAANITILLHNSPDPDALASGAGLCYLIAEKLDINVQVVYRGVIGRAENKALVEYLGIPMQELADEQPLPPGPYALVDTQPTVGNSPLPEGALPVLVLDHHREAEAPEVKFRDVRPWIGATSSIVYQYLRAGELNPPVNIATGLLYGIKTDTQSLSRKTSPADVAAYFQLLPLIDVDALVEIEQAQVPATYFKNLMTAMESASLYNGVVVSWLGELEYPDLVAEVADLLRRLESVETVICMGTYDEKMRYSVRTRAEASTSAALLAEKMANGEGSGGGHETSAAGQIPLDGRDAVGLVERLRERALAFLDLPPDIESRPLVA